MPIEAAACARPRWRQLWQGQVEILCAEAAAGSGFAGFSGACTGTGACQVKMDQDQSVTATFGPPKGTAIAIAKISSTRKSAGFFFTAPGAVTGYQCELVRPKKQAHRRKHKRSGGKGPKPQFSSCASAKTYKHLRPGRYTFKVRALDSLGADATPATRKFKIRSSKARH